MPSLLSAMATSITTALNIGSGGGEPSSANIQQFLRDAARELWGDLPPVQQQSLTVSNLFTAPLSYDRAFFVTYGGSTLLRGSEWNTAGGTLVFTPGAVGKGDSVTAFYSADPGLTDSSPVVDSSCIFGPDWLHPLMLVAAELQTHNRLMNVATTERADNQAALYRVKEARLQEMKAARKSVFDQWYADMNASIQARMATGDRPLAEHPAAGFRNRSRRRTVWSG